MIGKIEELLRRVEEFRPKTAAEVEEFRKFVEDLAPEDFDE